MVGIVASWRCKCGIRVSVLAEADPSQPPATQIAICPNCGESQPIQGDKIVSVTEDKADIGSLEGQTLQGDATNLHALVVADEALGPAVSCGEKERLLVAWNKAFDIYLRATVELAEAAGRIAHAEFEFLANRVRNARQAFLETAEHWNEHTAAHGC